MLTITNRDEAGVLILDLEGQIDGGPKSEKIQEIIKENIEKGQKKFILNLSDVKWLNSLGAGVLIASYASAKRQEASLKLFGVSDRVETVLKTCGLIPDVFDVFDSESEALSSF
ncbi:MAG: STAS domain-containing protein [Candidatus Krumholzibacteriota bacterium]|nr:STAS domain-containing protein [Candidatus Krumholzibacteriota bacterium]